MNSRIYPTAAVQTDYSLKINGIPVVPNTARVSAYPFNRRWPGHQRGVEQSEPADFVGLAIAPGETLDFEITSNRPLPEKLCEPLIRPRSLNVTPTVSGNTIRFSLNRPAYFTVEPFGRSHALHIFADPLCDFGIDPADPSVLYYGPGEHDAGQIELHSGETLYLDEGAVVYACISAIDAENIRILGHGILDNSRNREHILYAANEENNSAAVNNATRQHTIQLEYCTGVTIDGITIRDSLVYNIRPVACRDVSISHVKIIGCWRYNSDGIDMHNCENVHISDCFLRTFDDSICVKGFDCYYAGDVEKAVRDAMYRNGKVYDVFRNILIERCVIWNDWGKCLEIGAETRAEEMCGIRFSDCDILHVTGTPLDCCNVDYADVHDLVYENIRVEYDDLIPAPRIQTTDSESYYDPAPNPDYSPFLMAVSVSYHPEYSAGGSRRGVNRDITFRNIHLYARHRPKMLFFGYDEAHPVKNITLDGLYLNEKLLLRSDADLEIRDYTENILWK